MRLVGSAAVAAFLVTALIVTFVPPGEPAPPPACECTCELAD